MKYAVLTASVLALAATGAQADSLGNASKASGDSVIAVAELAESGVKLVAGAVALPFVVVGSAAESAGGAVRESGEDVWDSANEPLEVSPETVTAQPAPQVPYDRPERDNDDRRRN